MVELNKVSINAINLECMRAFTDSLSAYLSSIHYVLPCEAITLKLVFQGKGWHSGSFSSHRQTSKSQMYKSGGSSGLSLSLEFSPDCCGSVGWVSFHKAKGRWCDSWSGHMPGLQARSPVKGVQKATD